MITPAELEQMKAPWLGLQAEGAMLGKHAHELLRLIAEVEALQVVLKQIARGAARDMISRREIERIALTALGEP